jgi:predicted restriction endonuclease
LHHWGFDAGWFTIKDDFQIQVSSKVTSLAVDFGLLGNYDFIRIFAENNSKILLPKRKEIYPHHTAIAWHRENRFCN